MAIGSYLLLQANLQSTIKLMWQLTAIISVKVCPSSPTVGTGFLFAIGLQAVSTEQFSTLLVLQWVLSHFQTDNTLQLFIWLTNKVVGHVTLQIGCGSVYIAILGNHRNEGCGGM